MEQSILPSIRYRVEINGRTLPVEGNGLTQVLALLVGKRGAVRVFEHQEPDLIFDGTVDDSRKILRSKVGCAED